jgi:cyclohexyl-isocyanide hydratase
VHAGIVVFEGADELDVVGPYWVLAAAGVEVELVAKQDGPLALGKGLVIHPTATFETCPELDTLIVPGGRSDRDDVGRRAQQRDADVLHFVTTRARRAAVTASVCTGAFILAAAGVLAGKKANTHWAFRDELSELMKARGEDVTIVAQRVVWDGDLVTAGGVTSGIELGLALVEREFGAEARGGIEAALESETPP